MNRLPYPSLRRLVSALGALACLAALSVAACGSDADVFGESGATASSGHSEGGGGQSSSTTNSSAAGGGGEASSSSSTSTSTSTSGAGGAAACVDLGDPCTQCELRKCADTYCSCYQNVSCGLLASCAVACTPNDAACYQSCFTSNAAGISDGALLVDCAATHCPTECPGLTPLTECQRCVYEDCPAEMNKCLSNAACTALLYCLDACGSDTTCQNGCYARHPSGVSDATPVGECLQAKCAEPCF